MDQIDVKKILLDYKSQGKKFIGIFPHQLIPLELIHAFDVHLIIFSLAGNEEICTLGTDYLTAATCPFARVCIGHFENGNEIYSNLDAVIGLNYCNGELAAVDYMKVYFKKPNIKFTFPASMSDNGKMYFLNQFNILKSQLEAFLNKRLVKENLDHSIEIYNRCRKKLRGFKSQIGMGSLYQDILNELNLIGPEKFLENDYEQKIKEFEINQNGIDILFLGSFVGSGDNILKTIEENGLNIVLNQSESILFSEKDVLKDDSINDTTDYYFTNNYSFQNLADYYITNNYSFRMILDNKKIENIIQEYKKGSFKAVIYHVLKFCDFYIASTAEFKRIMAENNIPTLILERDYVENLGQLSTRIEAFKEMIT